MWTGPWISDHIRDGCSATNDRDSFDVAISTYRRPKKNFPARRFLCLLLLWVNRVNQKGSHAIALAQSCRDWLC